MVLISWDRGRLVVVHPRLLLLLLLLTSPDTPLQAVLSSGLGLVLGLGLAKMVLLISSPVFWSLLYCRYTADWAGRLGTAPALGGLELARLHVDYGHLLGSTVRRFIDESRLDDVNLVASHGHTVFHQPQRQLTFQLGDGETIASYVRSESDCRQFRALIHHHHQVRVASEGRRVVAPPYVHGRQNVSRALIGLRQTPSRLPPLRI